MKLLMELMYIVRCKRCRYFAVNTFCCCSCLSLLLSSSWVFSSSRATFDRAMQTLCLPSSFRDDEAPVSFFASLRLLTCSSRFFACFSAHFSAVFSRSFFIFFSTSYLSLHIYPSSRSVDSLTNKNVTLEHCMDRWHSANKLSTTVRKIS